MLRVLHDHLKFFLRVLLECIPVKEWITWLTGSVMQPTIIAIHSIGVPLDATRFYAGLCLTELKLAIWDSMRWQRLRRMRLLLQIDNLMFTGAGLGCLNRQNFMQRDLLLTLASTFEVLLWVVLVFIFRSGVFQIFEDRVELSYRLGFELIQNFSMLRARLVICTILVVLLLGWCKLATTWVLQAFSWTITLTAWTLLSSTSPSFPLLLTSCCLPLLLLILTFRVRMVCEILSTVFLWNQWITCSGVLIWTNVIEQVHLSKST